MTCEECEMGLKAAADQLLSEEFVVAIVELLQFLEALGGESFCAYEEDSYQCFEFIEMFIPVALPALVMGGGSPQYICNMAVPDTCDSP